MLVACCRASWGLLANNSRRAVEIAERYADGSADEHAREHARELADDASLHADFRHQELRRSQARDTLLSQARVLSAAMTAHATTFERPDRRDYRRAIRLLYVQTALALVRDVFGNPFRPVVFSPEWRTDTAVALATQMYESRDFGAMPILADALQDAGCDSDAILSHCRDPHEAHVRGCWVVDLVLGKA